MSLFSARRSIISVIIAISFLFLGLSGGVVAAEAAGVAEAGGGPVIRVDSYKSIALECAAAKDISFEVRVNGQAAGSLEASGSAGGGFNSDLGVYGAVPGGNRLSFLIQKSGVGGEVSCRLLREGGAQEAKGPDPIQSALPGRITGKTGETVSFLFILDCPGYFPKLEPEIDRAEKKLLAQYRASLPKGAPRTALVESQEGQLHIQLRKMLLRSKNEQEARKVLAEVLSND